MSLSTGAAHGVSRQAIAEGLRRLSTRPEWLVAALDPDRVLQALAAHIPEAQAGTLRLAGCTVKRLVLGATGDRWTGTYELTVEGHPGADRRIIPLRVVLTPPGRSGSGQGRPVSRPFGAEGWRCDVPELSLACELEPPQRQLDILPDLLDPTTARDLLEQAIRTGPAGHHDLRIRACRPELLDDKPGVRCTIRYELAYAPTDAARGWPPTVIAKAYRKPKGERAFHGMVALWQSSLATGDVVAIAEPLAYVPELHLLVQTALDDEQTLERLFRSALRSGASDALQRLDGLLRQTATGLATLHNVEAHADAVSTLDERVAQVLELTGRLATVAPDLPSAVDPLLGYLRAEAASQPADEAVASHGSFDADQVLVGSGGICIIDFDSFCLAEPALDVGHFRASLIDSGMKPADGQAWAGQATSRDLLARLDALAGSFRAEYEAHRALSRPRLWLWEALDYLRDALHLWTKCKTPESPAVLPILEHHLRHRDLLPDGAGASSPSVGAGP